MSKSLSNILTVFKVAKIIAKVVFILCIVGCAGCLLGLILLPLTGDLLSADIFTKEGLDLPSAYLNCIVGAIVCGGEIAFAYLSERCFTNVLDAETPFTLSGADEIFKLGIASIVISVATSVAAGITTLIIHMFSEAAMLEPDVSISVSISTGLFFMFLSLIFKHGAELKASNNNATDEKKDTAPQLK